MQNVRDGQESVCGEATKIWSKESILPQSLFAQIKNETEYEKEEMETRPQCREKEAKNKAQRNRDFGNKA